MIDYMEYLNNIAYRMVSKYYKIYKEYYRVYAIDIEDLNQQIALTVWKLLQKNEQSNNIKNDENMGKYLSKAVKFRLLAILRDCKKYMERRLFHFEDDDKLDVDILNDWIFNCVINIENKPTHDFYLLHDVKSVLTEQEYDVIYKKFYCNLTFKEIGEELNFSKPRAFQVYDRAIKKIRKHLNIT